MYRFSATLVGTAPLLFGAVKKSMKEGNELDDEFELRTWRERLNLNKNNEVVMSGYAIKSCVLDAASYLSERIKGQGQKTYSGKFQAGLRADAVEFPVLDGDGSPIKSEDVERLSKFVPADGKSGGGKRVWRHFPIIHEWQIPCRLIITDEIIDPERVAKYLQSGGSFKGLGTWRPARKGDYGTFIIDEDSIKITQVVV